MKLNNNLTNGSTTTSSKRKIVPPIPLERPEKKELQKGEYQTYKLRNDPNDADSPGYELAVPYFSTGTCEEWLNFLKNLEKVFKGQGVTSGPGQYTVARRLLEGEALSTFNNTATLQNAETVANFKLCVEAVTKSIFPTRAVLLQKRFMRRYLRKPASMKTREYVARLVELNNYIPKFPPTAGNGIPVSLPDDELVDVIEFGVPNSWQRNMILQDFDPLQHTVAELVSFCERLEQVEQAEGVTNANANADKGKTKKKKRQRTDDSDVSKDCMLHGKGCGHSTSECRTLMAQAKKMKQNWDAQDPSKKRAFKQKQELNALVSEALEEALKRKKKAKNAKKREREEELNEFENLALSDAESSESSDNE